MTLSKSEAKICISKLKNHFKKFNTKSTDTSTAFTFVVNFNGQNGVNKVKVYVRLEKDDYAAFYHFIEIFADYMLDLDVMAQLYEQGDVELKQKLGLIKEDGEPWGCDFKYELSFSNIFDRDYLIDGVEQIEGDNTYEVHLGT